MLDTTLGDKGASVYYWLNGEQKEVAYTDLRGAYRFGIELYNGNSANVVRVVPRAKRPELVRSVS